MYRTAWRPPVKPPVGAAQIDWGHPFTRGLFGCFLFNETAGAPINLVNRIPTTAAGSPTWNYATPGGMRTYATAGTDYDTVANLWGGSTDFTTVALVRLTAGDSFGMISSMASGGGSELRQGPDGTTFQFTDSVNGAATSPDFTASLGMWYHLVGTQLGTVVTLYVNAAPIASVSGNPGAISGTHTIMSRGASFGTRGDLALLLWLSRGLTVAEVQDSFRNPYAFLRPVVRRRYFVAAGAPAGDVEQVGLALAGMA